MKATDVSYKWKRLFAAFNNVRGEIKLTSEEAQELIDDIESIGRVTQMKITDDLLLKIGFVEVKHRPGIQAAFRYKSIRIERSNSGLYYLKGSVRRFIHEIQNIVHDVEGDDVQINP